jgi:hypothetical protein
MADRAMQRRGATALAAVVAALMAVTAFASTSAIGGTDAAWVVPKTLTVAAGAVTPAVPASVSCPASGALTSVPFTWAAPAGPAPSGYTITWTGATNGSSSGTATSHSVPASLLGNTTVTIVSDYGSWHSTAETRTIRGLLTLWSCS